MKAIETMRLVQTLKIYLWTNLENVKTSTLEGKKTTGITHAGKTSQTNGGILKSVLETTV